jgi:ribosomal protein S18 acetylase RimI-like enzyme
MTVALDSEEDEPGQHVRPATPADLDMIVECQTRCWVEAYTGVVAAEYLDDPQRPIRRRARWEARLAGERHVMVAVGSATPGLAEGVVSFGPSRDRPPVPELELMSLYVRARWHGSGLADRLLDAAIGGQAASLWVFVANQRAQAFYRRHGFGPDGAEALDLDTGLVEIRMVR